MLLDVIRALGRRWYVLVIGALATAGLVYGAYVVSPPQYTARALILLLPSQTAVGAGGNPFLELSGLEQPAGIVVAYFGSASARDEVKQQSETAKFTVGIDDSTRGPVIAIDVTDASDQTTLSVLDYVADRIPQELERLQSDVATPSNAMIGSMTLTIDSQAKKDNSATIRSVIAAGVLGIVLTGIVAFSLDGLLRRRTIRRSASDERAETTVDQVRIPETGGRPHAETTPPISARGGRPR
ncbi:hypothetical protein [uncultured Microbacterium sp.]|uniref:hypothetical protein n=1 Tax=uncultured Microbacterium sp. TaxID=191216 RepID=UPI0035CB6B1A